MARYEDTYAKCPYYKWEEGYRQCCRWVNDKASVQITFENKEVRKEFKRKFCKRNWQGCPLAMALAMRNGGIDANR